MEGSAKPAQPTEPPRKGNVNGMIEVRFLVPVAWHSELHQAAHSQRISLADLMRIIVRGFLRDRYTPEQLASLGI